MGTEQYIWRDGRFVRFEDATVHVLTHSMQYGSGIFEGIRANKGDRGTAVFRLREHMERFLNTARIYSMPMRFSRQQLEEAVVKTVRKNGLEDCYIRPYAFYDSVGIGLSTLGNVKTIIAAVPFGKYFGSKPGLKCRVSSWQRINSQVLPPEAKASGNYLNSLLASLEAKQSGADEAILLSNEGHVAEGPAENVFLVEDGKLVTPSKDADILMGITRDTVMKIAASMGIEFEERNVHREELMTCDEAFFTGTAAAITPIIKVDSERVGNGKPGPITKVISDEYERIIRGENEEFAGWLTYV